MDILYLGLYILGLIVSFYLLVKSADFFIMSSSVLGERAGISKFVIGLTIVAIGTSLPELVTSLIGLFQSSEGAAFVLGTVIGSNISNILLIFGVFMIIAKKFKFHTKYLDLSLFSFSTLLILMLFLYEGLNYIIGATFTILFILYMIISVKKSDKKDFEEEVDIEEGSAIKTLKSSTLGLILVGGLLFLNIAAKGIVYFIENIGFILNIPIEFLTLTTVAFATSLPELVVTYVSAKKNEIDMAIGNIIGSNISNILFILGISGIVKTFSFDTNLYIQSLFVLLLVTLIFHILLTIKKANRNIGYLFILMYITYIFWIF